MFKYSTRTLRFIACILIDINFSKISMYGTTTVVLNRSDCLNVTTLVKLLFKN